MNTRQYSSKPVLHIQPQAFGKFLPNVECWHCMLGFLPLFFSLPYIILLSYLSASLLAWALSCVYRRPAQLSSNNLQPTIVSMKYFQYWNQPLFVVWTAFHNIQFLLNFSSHWPHAQNSLSFGFIFTEPVKMSSQVFSSRAGDQTSAHVARGIKCTYRDCFRYFSSERDMKIHKKKEPSHEYCHKCDVDCEDDAELLIHMIESDKHSKALAIRIVLLAWWSMLVVCPMCGMEFKSNAGLEAHIPQASIWLSQPLL